jgi:cysteate synthase
MDWPGFRTQSRDDIPKGCRVKDNGSSLTVGASTQARHYVLVCSACGRREADDGLVLDCPSDHPASLLRTEYESRGSLPSSDREDLFRYRSWLPVVRTQENVGRTAVYRSKGLSKVLGLPNLWIAFNGYWPERGAVLQTATFKEFEAYTVLCRLPEHQVMLTVASSGNTGAAFAWACSQRQVPCLVIVPGRGMRRLQFRVPLDPCVKLVVIDDGDYPDAIALAAAMSRVPPFQAEGGVKNVGRRDGLATVLLSAFEEMGCLPSHYFQAVGSGTGAIAVLEAAKRVRHCLTGVTTSLPRLMLCQNLPFTPIYDAWQARVRSLDGGQAERFRDAVNRVYADELTNWAPPYGIHGGVYDSLVESRGDVLVADNASVRTAMDMFAELEEIDIEPAVGVAVACLREAAIREQIDKASVVLLNVTGGGRLRLRKDYPLVSAQPQLRFTRESLSQAEHAETVRRITSLCESAASIA